MAADVDYVEALNQIADKNQRQLSEALITLENRITDLMATAPLKDGSLFDLEWAVKARADIRKLVEDEYLATVDDIVRQYGVVALDTQKMLETYGSFTKLDPEIISQLQTLEFQGFQEVGTEYLDVVSKEVYQNTLTGTSFAASIASVKAVQGGRLASNAKQLVHDSLMQFDAAVNTSIGKQSGATKWKYVGRIIETTRPFCREHEGQTFTEEEIATLWEGSWAGKASGDPFIVRGGYNCGHQFRPVFDEEIGQEFEEETEQQATPTNAPPLLTKKAATEELESLRKNNVGTTDRSVTNKYLYSSKGSEYPYPVRFKPYGHKRGINSSALGNEQFGTNILKGMSAETLSLLSQSLNEVSELAIKFKVPSIRGVVPARGKAAANMGDGMLGINASYWNPIAKTAYVDSKKLIKQSEAAKLKRDAADQYYDKVADEYRSARDAYFSSRESSDAFALYEQKRLQLRKASQDLVKADKAYKTAKKLSDPKIASTFAKGGDLSDRPFTADGYFSETVDIFRSTVYHEFGHTVHQEYWRQVTDRESTGFERYLRRLFYVNGTSGKVNKGLFFPSKYSETNPKEWWAENFALYNMGRKDLVDDKLLAFMDEIVKSKGRITVFDNFNFDTGRSI